MAHVPSGQRWRVGVASIATNAEQSVEGQLLSASLRRHDGMTVGVSVARTAVASITRTETDPQALGEVPYSSMLVSFTAAREILPHVDGRCCDARARGVVPIVWSIVRSPVISALWLNACPCATRASPCRAFCGVQVASSKIVRRCWRRWMFG